MKSINLNLFSFNELPESIQDKIIMNWRNDDQYFWDDENAKSLNAFCDLFDISVKGYDYGYRNYINVAFNLDSEVLDFRNLKAAKYLWNNYKGDLFKPQYYYKGGKKRLSKILKHSDGVLTGYYMDNELLAPLYEFLDKPSTASIEDILNDCLNAWLSACDKDYQYWLSRESIVEDIKANDYLFLSNGELATKYEAMAA